MYYGNYGNYDNSLNRVKYEPYQFGKSQNVSAQKSKAQEAISFQKQSVEIKSSDISNNYNIHIKNKVNLGALQLTPDAMAMVNKYVTPEQAENIEAKFMPYFA